MAEKKASQKSFFELALVPSRSQDDGKPPWNAQEVPLADRKFGKYQLELRPNRLKKLYYGKAADYKEWL